MTKIVGSGSISQRHGSAHPDPDQHQNVMDPEHWKKHAPKMVFFCRRMLDSFDSVVIPLGSDVQLRDRLVAKKAAIRI